MKVAVYELVLVLMKGGQLFRTLISFIYELRLFALPYSNLIVESTRKVKRKKVIEIPEFQPAMYQGVSSRQITKGTESLASGDTQNKQRKVNDIIE